MLDWANAVSGAELGVVLAWDLCELSYHLPLDDQHVPHMSFQ